MRRTLLVLLLTCSIAEGQAAPLQDCGAGAGTVGSLTVIPTTESAFAYSELKSGTAEDVELSLSLNCAAACYIALGEPREVCIKRPRLDLQSVQGLQVGRVRLIAGTEQPFHLGLYPITVARPPIRFHFKVHASGELPPGTYALTGKVYFQAVGIWGVSQQRGVDVMVPVAVVDRDAVVKPDATYLRSPSAGQWILAVLLSPLLIPLGILMVLTGWDGC